MHIKILQYKYCSTLFLFLFLFLNADIISAQEIKKSEKSTFTTEEIANMNVSNVLEVLDRIPGVTSSGTDITINGSNDFVVLLDGRSLRDPISGRIRWSQVSLNNVGSVELIREGGSEYGENSSGGVILIKSKMADTFSGNLEVAAGNMNYKEYSGDLQTSISALKIGVMGGYASDDGWRANEHKIVTNGGLNLSYSPQYDISFSPSITYYEEIKGLAGPYFAPTPYNEATYESVSATLLADIKWLKSKTIYTDTTDQSIDAPPAPIPHDIKVKPRIWSQEFSFDLPLLKTGTLNAGTGYEQARIGVETDINNIRNPDELFVEKRGWMFTSYKLDIKNNISLYLGLRGNYYNNFDNSLNPEINIGYRKENYGAVLGFNLTDRVPNYKDRYRSDAFVVANPNLEKEKFTNYKLSLHYNPIESLSFNVTPFYTEVEDLISMDTVPTAAGPKRTFANIGSATIKGVDTSLSWSPEAWFNMSVSYNHQSAKDDETGLWLPMKAKHKLQTRVNVVPIKDLSISATVTWASKEFSDRANTIAVGSWYEAKSRVEYTINDYKLFFQIDNMFNRERIEPFLIPAKTRSFFTGIRYSF